ncbi:MAG: hypothetical protein H6Q90_421 [Deltaproteobacteria bacterium]|nr:hypothetical protein [Deltaproteobacteria bacterium]
MSHAFLPASVLALLLPTAGCVSGRDAFQRDYDDVAFGLAKACHARQCEAWQRSDAVMWNLMRTTCEQPYGRDRYFGDHHVSDAPSERCYEFDRDMARACLASSRNVLRRVDQLPLGGVIGCEYEYEHPDPCLQVFRARRTQGCPQAL